MQINKSKIYILIPVYNEATTLPHVIHGLLKHSYKNIILVDDGSTLNIREIAMQFPVTYLRHKVNLGQGAALQTGLDYVKKIDFDAIVTFDGDGQHDPGDIDDILTFITNNSADVVLGSRFLIKNKNQVPLIRKIVLQMARLINFTFSGLFLSDAHNGLRAMNKKAADLIVFSENRMAHASEILFHIKKYRLRFKEVPVSVNYPKNSQKKAQSSIDSFRILFDLVLHKLFE